MPSFLDWFGWCTWDAFYTEVTAEGVHEGLKRHFQPSPNLPLSVI